MRLYPSALLINCLRPLIPRQVLFSLRFTYAQAYPRYCRLVSIIFLHSSACCDPILDARSLTPIEVESELHQLLSQYLVNTHAATHSSYELELIQAHPFVCNFLETPSPASP